MINDLDFLSKTSKCMDPLRPLTLIYDSLTLPIMCKSMYDFLDDFCLTENRQKIACVNTALDDLISSITVYPKAAKRSILCAPLLSLNGSTHRSSRTPCL